MAILHIDLRPGLDENTAILRYGWDNLNQHQRRTLPLAEVDGLVDQMNQAYYVRRPQDFVITGQQLYRPSIRGDRSCCVDVE